jgi:hypothetical protein
MLISLLVGFAISRGPYMFHTFFVFVVLGLHHSTLNQTFTLASFLSSAINPILLPINSE